MPSAAPEDSVSFAYNRLGEQVALRDQNGTVREFVRDAWGRLLHDQVRSFGTPDIDDSIKRLTTVYDGVFARVDAIATYTDTAGAGDVVNELSYEYDTRGRVTRFAQSPAGPVDQDSLAYEAAYDDSPLAAENRTRLFKVLYPTVDPSDDDRTVLELSYGEPDSVDDLISRVNGMGISADGLQFDVSVSHDYVGLGRRARSIYSSPGRTLARDRSVDPANGTRLPGVYPGLDRFGRVKHHLVVEEDGLGSTPWSAQSPALYDLSYTYDRVSNITARRDARHGVPSGSSRHELYAHDGLDRLTQSARGGSLTGPQPKLSQFWELDILGNWTEVQTADADGVTLGASPGVDVTVEDRDFNATNEFVGSTIGNDEFEHEYDANGNLLVEQVDDGGGGAYRYFAYDAWNRLTRVSYGSSGGPSSAQRRVEYFYYAGDQLSSRRGDDDFDGTSEGGSFYYYDPSWNLLEVHRDPGWGPGLMGQGGFVGIGGAPYVPSAQGAPAPESAEQYIWDPVQSHELVRFQTAEGEAPDPPVEFNDRYWVVTDRGANVVAVVPDNSTGGLGAESHLRYTAYGRAQLSLLGDADGDGSIDADDLNAWTSASGASIGAAPAAGYRADVDFNRDGVIDADDLNIVILGWGASAPPMDQLSTVGGAGCDIGYGGALYDHAVGLYNMRKRWYAPARGGWLTRDPAGYVDGMSLYLYVRGNPYKYYDPWGLSPLLESVFAGVKTAVRDAADWYGRTSVLMNQPAQAVTGHAVGIVAEDAIGVVEGVANLTEQAVALRLAQSPIGPVAEWGRETSVPYQLMDAVAEDGAIPTAARISANVEQAVEEQIDAVLSGDPEAIGGALRGVGYAGLGGAGTLSKGGAGARVLSEASDIVEDIGGASIKAGEHYLHRPYVRNSVRAEVEARAPRTADGRFIDPNTRQPINGRYHLGHKYGQEYWRHRNSAERMKMTQLDFNNMMNNPDLYQIEDPVSNMSHRFECP